MEFVKRLLIKNRQTALMSKKYYSMLVSGTVTMMLVSFVMMSDSLIAGIVLGKTAVEGIGLVLPIHTLATFFGCLFSLGVPVLYSTEMGKFNKRQADRVFGFGVLMSVVVGVALFLFISLFGDAFLLSCSPPEEVLNLAREYLAWIRPATLIIPMHMRLAAVVYSDGDETICNIANSVGGLGNIICSFFLSRVTGIRGIGMSTFLFTLISLLLFCIHFFRERNSLRWNLYFSARIFFDVIKYSAVDASVYLSLSAVTAVLNAFVSARFGPDLLILVSAVTLCREFQIVFDGIGEAVSPMFGVYLGEENHSGLRSIYKLANRTAIIEGIVVTFALMVFAPFAPEVLKVTSPEVADQVVICIRMTALGSTFASLLYLLTSYYLVIDQIALALVVCLMRDMLLCVPLALAFGKLWGPQGMFVGIAAAPALTYVILLNFLTVRYGKKDCPLLLSRIPGDDNCYLFNFSNEPEQVIDVQGKVEQLLLEHSLDRRVISRTMLLIEELYNIVRERNGGRAVLCECTVTIRSDEIRIISKDEGVLFDITGDDAIVTSLSAYVIISYFEKMEIGRKHLTTMSFNRSVFLIKTC